MSPEVILVQVDIQANNQRLVELTKQLNENRTALKALTDANKDGQLSNDDLAAGQVRLSQSSKQAQGEIALLTKANADQTKANQAGAGSIEQLRAQLALGTKAYNGMSQSERESTEAGQKLQATNRGLSDQLKILEKAVGDTRRNVGNYNEGIKDVNVVSGQLTGGLQTAVSQGLSPFKNELERGSGILGKFKSGSDLVKQGLGLLKGAGETGSLGFKAIAGGIALTGIGLFLLAIGAVVTYFTQSAEGGRKLASILGGLGGVLQVATDLVSGLGKGLIEAFSSPMESLKKFGEAVGKFLSDPIGFARSLGASIGNVAGQFKAAYVAGGEFAAREREIAGLRRQDAKDDAETMSRVEVLLRLTKERGVAAKDQLAALREAGRLEADMASGNIALAQKELQLVKDRRKAKGAAFSQELIDQQQALELEIVQTVAARNETNARIQVRESVFREKQRTEAAAAALTQRQDAVKNRQTQVEQELLQVAKGSAAELVLLQRKIDLTTALVLASEKKTAADRKLLLDTAEVEKKALQDAFNQKALEAAKKHTADTVAEANREYAEAQKALEDYLNTQRAAVELDRAAGKTSEFEYKKQLNAIEKAGNDAALVNAKDYAKDSGAIQKKAADTELGRINLLKDEKKRIADVENNIQQASLQAASATSDLIIDGFGKESAAGQVALAAKKVFALAEIAINLQRQLSANALYGSTLGPLGLAYITATDALAIAGALASAAKIAGFAQGGYVSGAGTGTSDSIPARLSNGESVMNANTTARFGGLLSHLNVLGGGVAFATGGLVPGSPASAVPINDGGLLARQLGGAAPALDYPTLIKAIADYGNFEITGRQIERTTARREFPRAASTLG